MPAAASHRRGRRADATERASAADRDRGGGAGKGATETRLAGHLEDGIMGRRMGDTSIKEPVGFR
eukprot:8607903-Pyramimonas_sp.AAC.1